MIIGYTKVLQLTTTTKPTVPPKEEGAINTITLKDNEIELIKTKEELEKIVSKVQETNSSPILLSKLKTNLQEIEDDINFSKRKYNINGFYLVISVEIFFLFSFLSSIIIQKSWESGLHFLEGVFSYPATG